MILIHLAGLELNDTNQVTPTMFSMDLRAKQPVSQIIKVRLVGPLEFSS